MRLRRDWQDHDAPDPLTERDRRLALELKLAVCVKGLHEIASWGEGPVVTTSFDGPATAILARATLKEIGITGPPTPHVP